MTQEQVRETQMGGASTPCHIVRYDLLSAEAVRKHAVVEITKKADFDMKVLRGEDRTPMAIVGGINDERLGPSFRGGRCATCKLAGHECPGHFGYYELGQTMYNPMFIDRVVYLLNRVCGKCSRPAVNGRLQKLKSQLADCYKAIDCQVHEIVQVRTALEAIGEQGRVSQTYKELKARLKELRVLYGTEESRSLEDQLTVTRELLVPGGDYGHKLVALPSTKECYRCSEPRRGYSVDHRLHCVVRRPMNAATKSNAAVQLTDDDGATSFPANRAFAILAGIPPSQIPRLGLPVGVKPEEMLLNILPIAPPCMRPVIYLNGRLARHDVSVLYLKVIAIDKQLRQQRGDVSELRLQCQRCIFALFQNSGKYPVLRAGKQPFKSYSQTLRGKEGLIRSNLMGKRGEFCARSVLIGDPELSYDQVGLPRSFAKAAVKEVYVNDLNRPLYETTIRYVIHAVRSSRDEKRHCRGQVPPLTVDRLYDKYRGKRIYMVKTPAMKHAYPILLFVSGAARVSNDLPIGTVLQVGIEDGDVVIINRQPTLHRGSMLGMKAKFHNGGTVCINPGICNPLNGDFDGDEINIHFPQSDETRAEVSELAAVWRNLINPQNQKTLVGCWQDGIIGIYMLCRADTFFTRDEVCQLLMHIGPYVHMDKNAVVDMATLTPTIWRRRRCDAADTADGIIEYRMEEYWTGKSILSLLFPPTLQYACEELQRLETASVGKDMAMLDKLVCIVNGILISGQPTKTHTAPGTTTFAKKLVDMGYKHERVLDFIMALNRLGTYYVGQRGLTAGIRDIVSVADKTAADKAIGNADQQLLREYAQLYSPVGRRGEIGYSGIETVERRTNSIYNTLWSTLAEAKSGQISRESGFRQLIESGSKGSKINLNQVAGCVGQVNVAGERVHCGFRGRTLPHYTTTSMDINALTRLLATMDTDNTPTTDRSADFKFFDTLALSRGWCPHSYMEGLSPAEFFFHAMAGREGLAMTAVSTRETGYRERQFVKCTEDFNVAYDGTVRDSLNTVVSFKYGDDGFGADQITSNRLPFTEYTNTAAYLADCVDADHLCMYRLDDDVELTLLPASVGRDQPGVCLQCVAIDDEVWQLEADYQLITELKRKTSATIMPTPPFHYEALAERVMTTDNFTTGTVASQCEVAAARYAVLAAIDRPDEPNCNRLLRAYVNYCLSSRRCRCQLHLNVAGVTELARLIEEKVGLSFAAPGEAVGILAGQSVSEPATQMTLNTFHFAGNSSKNVSLGGPRLTQLNGLCQSTDSILYRIYLQPGHEDKTSALTAIRLLSGVTLMSLFDRTAIIYDPVDLGAITNTAVLPDRELVAIHYMLDTADTHFYSTGVHNAATRDQCSCRWLFRFNLHDGRHVTTLIYNHRTLTERLYELLGTDTLHECIVNPTAVIHTLRIRLHCKPYGAREAIDTIDDAKEVMAWLETLVLTGIPNMAQAVATPYPLATSNTYYIMTAGIKFTDVWSAARTSIPIDYDRLMSNDIRITARLYGIEAARVHYIDELREVYNSFQLSVGYRHYSLMADYMTYAGQLKPFTFNGRLKSLNSPMLSASFERADRVFSAAALYQATDNGMTPTAQLMLAGEGAVGSQYAATILTDTPRLFSEGRPQRLVARAMAAPSLPPERQPVRKPVRDQETTRLLNEHQRRLDAIREQREFSCINTAYAMSSPSRHDPTAAALPIPLHTADDRPYSPTANIPYSPSWAGEVMAVDEYDPMAVNPSSIAASSGTYVAPRTCPSSPMYCPPSPTYRPHQSSHGLADLQHLHHGLQPYSPSRYADGMTSSRPYSPSSPAYTPTNGTIGSPSQR